MTDDTEPAEPTLVTINVRQLPIGYVITEDGEEVAAMREPDEVAEWLQTRLRSTPVETLRRAEMERPIVMPQALRPDAQPRGFFPRRRT